MNCFHYIACGVLAAMLMAGGLRTHGQELAVGEWQDNMSFVSVRGVRDAGNRVYAATGMAMFYYDKDEGSTVALTKSDGLSDVGISTFAYSKDMDCLAVAYTNSGLDLVTGDERHHIADIRRSNVSGDKMIYHARFDGRHVYLATGFGIVVVNADRHEIAETYYLGEGGKNWTVYDVAFMDSLIVAGTDHGLLYAPRGSNRLHIYETWQRDTLSALRGMSVRMLEVTDGRLVAAACGTNPDSMTVYSRLGDGTWDSLTAGAVRSMHSTDGRLVMCRNGKVEVYGNGLELVSEVGSGSLYGATAQDADIDAEGTLWIGHPWAGLIELATPYDEALEHAPQGPFNDDYVYSLTTTWDRLYVCPGGKKPTYEPSFIYGGLYYYSIADKRWEQMSRGEVTGEITDVLQVAVDPRNRKHVSATAWGCGVLDIESDVLKTLYDQHNSDGALTSYTSGEYENLRVSGLAYDREGNLWITNSLVDKGLVVHRRDGSWQAFDISPLLQGQSQERREIDKVIWDSLTGYKWFAGRANRIYVHDGESRLAVVNPNNGSRLETHSVTCLVQDRAGDIWFGTDKGLKVIYDGYRAFNNGGNGETAPVNCSNILYNEDGINEYLMAYESITCIAVDGANRKWVGTANNGLYLISANGQEQLHHFTTANSPIASNKIAALAVHPATGIVYIGTGGGLQSYRSTATAAYAVPMDDIHAFPNPVKPGYDGPIAVKGFTRDALVHISDVRGHVVYSGRADGGQVVWNGRTLDGTPVASGTYYVFASDEAGNNRSVAKILIVR